MFMMVDVQLEEETVDVDMDIESLEDAIPEISFHALVGTAHSQTFQVIGNIGNQKVIVLIDWGSTHNFIEQSVVTKFGLQMVCGKSVQVTVRNKEIIECTGCYMGLSLSIQGFIVQVNFYVLPEATCQAILGV
jgi:hypothetical protein